jgi:sec-independent protein translocase protein TatC
MMDPYPPESQRLDVVGHLAELRKRLLVCLAAFALAAAALFALGHVFLSWLEWPARGLIQEFIFIAPTEAFLTYLQAVLLAALIVTSPVILYEAWAFLGPALPPRGQRRVLLWLLLAQALFLGGLAFAFAVLLPAALKFLLGFGAGVAQPAITVSKYISFAASVLLLGGVVFEIPVVLGLLTEVGLVDAKRLRAGRRQAVIVNLVAAAVLTPTQDIFNLLLFAAPMILLYEIGILLSALVGRPREVRPDV